MFVFSARAGSGRSEGVGSGQRSFAGLVGSSDQGRKPSVVRGPDVTTSGPSCGREAAAPGRLVWDVRRRVLVMRRWGSGRIERLGPGCWLSRDFQGARYGGSVAERLASGVVVVVGHEPGAVGPQWLAGEGDRQGCQFSAGQRRGELAGVGVDEWCELGSAGSLVPEPCSVEVGLLVGEVQQQGEIVDARSPAQEFEVGHRDDALVAEVDVVVPEVPVRDLSGQTVGLRVRRAPESPGTGLRE